MGRPPARHRSAAPVRREHLLSRAIHARVFRSPDRAVGDGRAAHVGRLLASARPQRGFDRGLCADRLDHRAGRRALDRQPSGRPVERIPGCVQRVHADPASPDSGSALRVLSAGSPGARSPSALSPRARCARAGRLVRPAIADGDLSDGLHRDFNCCGDAGKAARLARQPVRRGSAKSGACSRCRDSSADAIPAAVPRGQPRGRPQPVARRDSQILRRLHRLSGRRRHIPFRDVEPPLLAGRRAVSGGDGADSVGDCDRDGAWPQGSADPDGAGDGRGRPSRYRSARRSRRIAGCTTSFRC